ncbi:VolA/Pla-1 family phospholipase [Photobacterium lipolyticum]|uniref:Lipase n=1 Tax=Photobacterium lipolyticum TaxID=266810 RepID=A0A2T3MUK1_9GAMM|nr:VolA/Pla-1 family phospholipase [Photobacterium lipolyticum]PSW03620.1 lipase [Photobacterium lipolyticum]
MKKNILAVLIASSISLYGCGDETELTGNPTIDPIIEKSLKAETKINFDLITDSSNPVIVIPTFLAMDATDGTLSVEGSNGSDKYSTNLADPKTAMGKTDGWSTTQPFVINFTGNDLDAASADNGFYLIESKNPTDATDSAQPTSLSAADGDFMVTVSGSTLTVVLLKPLKPASNYMFAITDDLKDVKGNSVGMTGSYAILKATTTPPSPALIPAQTIVHATEKELDIAGVNADGIIFSSWFTTASVGDVLSATKAVIAQTIATVKAGGTPEIIWKGESNPNDLDLSKLYSIDLPVTGVDLADAIDADLMLTNVVKSKSDPDGSLAKAALKKVYEDTTSATGVTIKVYKGTVNLPYFLSDDPTNEAWKKTPWESAIPSLAKIANVMKSGTDANKAALAQSLAGVDIAKLLTGDPAEMIHLIGLEGKLADGSQLDTERLITKYSPLPKIKSIKPVPVLVFMPDTASAPAPGAVIYQHGITSVKETSYMFAANHMGLAVGSSQTPKAIIAIDHPLHGERALTDGTVTTSATPDVYMNLNYLNVGRDNIRQSIIDDLGLRTSLTVMKGSPHPILKTIDISKISFFGHSMGAITGIGTYGLGNKSLGLTDPAKEAQANALFNFSSGAFANPGGGIPSLLLESKAFGPTIKHSLLLGSGDATYESVCGSALIGSNCFTTFFNSLDAATQAEIDGVFSTFAYAAQTVMDTVDPYNLASGVKGPVYVMQAFEDQVVPNQTTTYSVIGGTQPLVKQLGLSKITEDQTAEINGVAEFNDQSKAQHSSAIAPQYKDGENNVIDPVLAAGTTKAAQTQIATFTAAEGQAVGVGDRTLIQ